MAPVPGPLIRAIQSFEFPHKLGICERLFARSLARHGVCWVRTAANIDWKLDLANPTHRWIVYGLYEGPGFLRWAKRFLPPNGVVVDSGANIGQMLLYLAQWVPAGRVHAFEPGEEARAWLIECLARNANLPVEVSGIALGAETGQMSLAMLGDASSHGAWNQVRASGEGQATQVRKLADVLRARGVGQVDLWKLDVEGFELQALAGAEEYLAPRRIRAIYAELGFENGDRIRRYLEQFGYKCRLFDRRGRLYSPEVLPQHTNGLFLAE